MKRIIDVSEVIGTVETPVGEYEVCASADANYDPDARQLVVRLESFLRSTDIRVTEKHVPAEWLPKAETITESVGSEEALALARTLFQRWVQKIRRASPSLHNSAF